MGNGNTYTAFIVKTKDGWYSGQLSEHPEVLTQGKTIEELIKNLTDALREVLKDKEEDYLSRIKRTKYKVIRRKIHV